MFEGQVGTRDAYEYEKVRAMGLADTPVEAEGRVIAHMRRNMELIDQIGAELTHLQQRLDPILRPPTPMVNGAETGAGNTARSQSPVADGLDQTGEKLRALLGHARMLSARVDV